MAPPTPPRAERLAALLRTLEARGVPVTASRRQILEGVLDLEGRHPTADEVHARTVARHPGVGRATVYRALESFVRAGVMTKASHLGAAVRYDAVVERHHHLLCLGCDRIIDIEDARLDAVPAPDTSPLGFEVSDVQVQVRGLCRSCRTRLNDEKEEAP